MIRPPSKEVSFLVIGLAVLVGGLGSRLFSNATNPMPQVDFEPPSFHFSNTRQGQTLAHTFRLVNRGSAAIVIAGAESSCSCTTTDDLAGRILNGGQVVEVPVSLKTGPGDGPESGRITIRYRLANDTNAQIHSKQAGVSTEVVPDYRVRPTLIDFGTIDHLNPVSRTVRLRPEAMPDVAILGLSGRHEAISVRQIEATEPTIDKILEVTFSGQSLWKSGPFEEMATIETSSIGKPTTQVMVRARFEAPVEVDPMTIVVGTKQAGTVEREIKINARRPVRITGLHSPDPAIFLASDGQSEGKELRVKVSFAGGDSRRAINGEVTIDLAISSENGAIESRTFKVSVHRLASE